MRRAERPAEIEPLRLFAAGAVASVVVAWDGSREAVRAVHDAQDTVAKLIRFGWLDQAKCGDKKAIAAALTGLARRAIELEATSVPPSM